MKKTSRWERCRMVCPEGKGEGMLLVHWEMEGDSEILCGMQCGNPYLKDLGGGDCRWSCWEKVSTGGNEEP
jgi:hypothetical protein